MRRRKTVIIIIIIYLYYVGLCVAFPFFDLPHFFNDHHGPLHFYTLGDVPGLLFTKPHVTQLLLLRLLLVLAIKL